MNLFIKIGKFFELRLNSKLEKEKKEKKKVGK